MAIELDERYQTEAYEKIKDSLDNTKRAGIIMPTGTGKSYLALKLIEDKLKDCNQFLYVSPSPKINARIRKIIKENYLEEQAKEIINKIRFVTYHGMQKRFKEHKEDMREYNSDTIILDEVHRSGAEEWGKAVDYLLENNQEANILGMTATPLRTDGQNMIEKRCGEITYELKVSEAVARGILKLPIYISARHIAEDDIISLEEKLELVEDEKKRKELEEKLHKVKKQVENGKGLKDIYEKHLEHDGKYIMFCNPGDDIEKLQEQAQREGVFNSVNENQEYLIVESSRTEQENQIALDKFERERTDTLKLLYTKNMLNEGYHDEEITGEIMARPTKSYVLYVQQLGRILSKDRETSPVVLDLVGNIRYFKDFRLEVQEIIKQGQAKGETIYDEKVLESFKILEEHEEFVQAFEEVEQAIDRYIHTNIVDELIDFIENNKRMPQSKFRKNGIILNVENLTEKQKYEIRLRSRWKYSQEKKKLEEYDGMELIEISEEDREIISKLRNAFDSIKEKSIAEEIIEFIEQNKKKPQACFSKNAKRLVAKDLTEKEKKEMNLASRWNRSLEKKKLKEYDGIKLTEIPEEDREIISKLRNAFDSIKEKSVEEELIEFIEQNKKMPQSNFKKEGRILKKDQLTEKQKIEQKLYSRWFRSAQRKKFKEYEKLSLDEIPEEDRELISKLRNAFDSIKEKSIAEEIIEFIEKNKRIPQKIFSKNKKVLKVSDLTEKQHNEINLASKWYKSKERQKLMQYEGIELTEIPEEDRELISKLRNAFDSIKKKTTAEEVIEFIEQNKRVPTKDFKKNGKYLTNEELTESQRKEKKLYSRWIKTEERRKLMQYDGIELIEIPEEDRDIIRRLREVFDSIKEETVAEEIINFIQTNKRMPKIITDQNGKYMGIKKMTEEEREEQNLYSRWIISKERQKLAQYDGIELTEIPEEDRDMIRRLREAGVTVRKRKGQEIGQATFEVPVEECDKADEVLGKLLEQTKEKGDIDKGDE